MNNYLASFGPVLADHLWQSTAFAAAVWVLTLLLRKNSAGVRHGLWLAASTKFLIPFSLLIAVGSLLPKPRQLSAPAMYRAMKVTEQPFTDISLSPKTSTVHAITLTQRIAGHIPVFLFALWLAGFATALIIWLVRWRKASIWLRAAVPAGDGRELEILRRLEARISGRPHSPLRLKLSTEQTEPSIYGIFRPLLVWPHRLSDRLRDEHIEAIMAHELAHDRRLDNSAAALHMLVEALFWFHPLVWWMEHRMIEERERACDEAVVGMGASRDAYAEGILETCRFCVASAFPCVSGVTGADLKNRVLEIVTSRTLTSITWPKKILLSVAALCLIAVPVLLGQLDTSFDWEKAAGGKMSFDVASVKQNTTNVFAPPNFVLDTSDSYSPTDGLLSAHDFPLITYIQFAYKLELTPGQIRALLATLPKWISVDRFDIEARGSSNATKDQMRLMMQSLLADRFKLAVHFETQQLPVYALALLKPEKLGLQLHLHSEGPPCDLTAAAAGSAPPASAVFWPPICDVYQLKVEAGRAVLGSRNTTMDLIAHTLPSMERSDGIDRPVINKTGLKGRYDFTLSWTPESPLAMNGVSTTADDAGPTFLEALKDQLGLKLDSGTGPVESLIVDHVEEPAPN